MRCLRRAGFCASSFCCSFCSCFACFLRSFSNSLSFLRSLLFDQSFFFSAFSFFLLTTNMLVGRFFSPGPSITPESHNPAVVIGSYADWVFLDLRSGDDARESVGGWAIFIVVRTGMGVVGVGVVVAGGVSGRVSSLMRKSSPLRLLCRSSSVSGSA